jgi:DNA-binding MurR/RpiR family transcriptional regulator
MNENRLGSNTFIRMREIERELTSAEKKVSDYILEHPEDVIRLTITELAIQCESSESTIVRLCKKLRFKGYQDLRVALAQDLVSPVKQIHEQVELNDQTDQIMRKVFQAAVQALHDTETILSAESMKAASQLLKKARSITFFGIGASGVIAQDAFYRFSKLGISCHVASDGHSQMNRAILLSEGDVVIGISHSGRSREVIHAMAIAKERGAKTIAITQFGHSPITEIAEIVLFTSSRETLYRAEAMASRIAQSVILDSLFVDISLDRYEEVLRNYERMKAATRGMKIDDLRDLEIKGTSKIGQPMNPNFTNEQGSERKDDK